MRLDLTPAGQGTRSVFVERKLSSLPLFLVILTSTALGACAAAGPSSQRPQATISAATLQPTEPTTNSSPSISTEIAKTAEPTWTAGPGEYVVLDAVADEEPSAWNGTDLRALRTSIVNGEMRVSMEIETGAEVEYQILFVGAGIYGLDPYFSCRSRGDSAARLTEFGDSSDPSFNPLHPLVTTHLGRCAVSGSRVDFSVALSSLPFGPNITGINTAEWQLRAIAVHLDIFKLHNESRDQVPDGPPLGMAVSR